MKFFSQLTINFHLCDVIFKKTEITFSPLRIVDSVSLLRISHISKKCFHTPEFPTFEKWDFPKTKETQIKAKALERDFITSKIGEKNEKL